MASRMNSMASRMNSGGSIDLNRMKLDPRTDEKFSFNLDIVAATAWYGQEASRELSHGRARNSGMARKRAEINGQ